MMNEDYKQVYVDAIKTFGTDSQLILAIEELSELQKAITKLLRYRSLGDIIKLRESIIEEIADVEIMIEQLKIICFIDDKSIDEVKVKKLDKLRKLIEVSEKGGGINGR